MRYIVYVNDKKKAIFFNQLDALQYKDIIKNINRLAGYKDKYTVKQEN